MQTKLPSDSADDIRKPIERLKLWASDLPSDAGLMQSMAIRRRAATAIKSAVTNLERAARLIEQALDFEAKPVFRGELTPDDELRYWCPFCCEWHYHQCPPAGIPSLRSSHCGHGSPLCGKTVIILLPNEEPADSDQPSTGSV